MGIETLLTKTQIKGFRNTKKFGDWCRYFLDETNSATYGNKTQAALKAYKLDPVKRYNVASCIGYQNYIKLQNLTKQVGSDILEKKGIGLVKLMELGYKKVEEGTFKDWASFMHLLGYFISTNEGFGIANLNQVHISLGEEIRRSREQRGLPT